MDRNCRKVYRGRDPRCKRRPHYVRWYGTPDPDTGEQQRFYEHFTTEQEAIIFAKEKELEQAKGQSVNRPDKITLQQLCHDFMAIKKIRPGTRDLYQNTIDRLLGFFPPGISVGQITPRVAERFISSVKPMRPGKAELSSSAVHRVIRQCTTIFNKAIAWGYAETNPFRSVERPKVTSRPWHYLTPSEYHRLLDVTPDLRTKVLYALCYTAGLRLGEASSLLWSDLDFEAAEVTVRNREATADLPGFHIKDYEQRAIPLPGETMRLLAELRHECLKAGPFVVIPAERYELLKRKWQACRKTGGEIAGREMLNHVRRRFKQHVKKAGIVPGPGKRLSVHELRKAAILNWSKANRNPKVTQEWAGHSNLATTMQFYSQVTEDQTKTAIDALNKMLDVA